MNDEELALLDSLLGCDDMVVEEKKPKFIFNCVEDNETYYPDVVARRRYGGYKPPKPPKVIFVDPFAKKAKEEPAYMKQLQNSMERLRIRDNDERDRKIKYIKKKYPD